MSDEIKLLKQRDLGARAERLRQDELLTQIFEGLKSQYMTDWAKTHPSDTEMREKLYMRLNALLDVHEQLLAIINDGKAAKAFLEAA